MKKRFLSLALSLSLAVSLFVPAFAAGTDPVIPTAPEWINEEDYIIFPGDEVYLPENWAKMEGLREQVRSGAAEMNIPEAPNQGKNYQGKGGSPGWRYEVALCWLKCAENRGITTDSGKEAFYEAASAFSMASSVFYLQAEDRKSEAVSDMKLRLLLWEDRALLLCGYDFAKQYRYWDLWEGWGEELGNLLPVWGITLEEFFAAPYMDSISDEIKDKITEDVIEYLSLHDKPIPASPVGNVQIFIDGKYIRSDAPAVITNGRTTIPIRAVAEALGAEVGWEEATRQVTLTRAGTAIIMTIDSTTALVNNEPIEMDVTPYISSGGRTMIPVRYVAEFFGQKVDWDGDNYRVFITEDKSVTGDSNLEAWALPMGAMLTVLGGEDATSFGISPRSAKAVNAAQVSLRGSWNIENRQDLTQTVLSMTLAGHNASFREMAADVKQRSAEERAAISEASSAWPEYMWAYTEQLDEKWGDRGILAWDLFRMSNLVQWGYTAGYVTYEEALALLEPAAILLFANFSSWDEAYENYVDGYNWWARNDVLGKNTMETYRGGVYLSIKSNSDTGHIFDDSLFETGVIGLPEE